MSDQLQNSALDAAFDAFKRQLTSDKPLKVCLVAAMDAAFAIEQGRGGPQKGNDQTILYLLEASLEPAPLDLRRLAEAGGEGNPMFRYSKTGSKEEKWVTRRGDLRDWMRSAFEAAIERLEAAS